MIVKPFSFGEFTVVDQQELSPRQQDVVSISIRDALLTFPEEYKCKALRENADGDYPMMRFGIFRSKNLVGGWWMGCNKAVAGHTKRNARIISRPTPGYVRKYAGDFWKGMPIVQLAEYLLNNKLETREGGTIEFVGLKYAHDPSVDRSGEAGVAREVFVRVEANQGMRSEKTALDTGGNDILVRKVETTRLRR